MRALSSQQVFALFCCEDPCRASAYIKHATLRDLDVNREYNYLRTQMSLVRKELAKYSGLGRVFALTNDGAELLEYYKSSGMTVTKARKAAMAARAKGKQ